MDADFDFLSALFKTSPTRNFHDYKLSKPADKFSFGLWTLTNRGRDRFGDFVRPTLPPVETAET
jgi:hypothetical protein